jgi:hypothetical protein
MSDHRVVSGGVCMAVMAVQHLMENDGSGRTRTELMAEWYGRCLGQWQGKYRS